MRFRRKLQVLERKADSSRNIRERMFRGFLISQASRTWILIENCPVIRKGADMAKNMISDETIDYVGILAKLDLSVEEKARAKEDMANMLDYIDMLNGLDTEGVEPMSHVFPVHNVFREDIVENGNDRENMLENAPDRKDGCYKVPKTVE